MLTCARVSGWSRARSESAIDVLGPPACMDCCLAGVPADVAMASPWHVPRLGELTGRMRHQSESPVLSYAWSGCWRLVDASCAALRLRHVARFLFDLLWSAALTARQDRTR